MSAKTVGLAAGLLTLMVTAAPAPASAVTNGGAVSTPEHPYHPNFANGIHNIWGAKLVSLSVFNKGHTARYFGPGVFLERILIPHVLEGEVTSAATFNSHGALIPVDILLKKPFNVSPMFEPFVGVGFAMAIHVADGHAALHPGVIFSGGTCIWLGRHVGISLEVDYSIVAEDGVTMELELATGVAYRFP